MNRNYEGGIVVEETSEDEEERCRLRGMIYTVIKEIGEDETCDEKFYSLEELRDKYLIDWKYWETLDQYTYNDCILFPWGRV
jgi:hypothetical protein